MSDYVGSRYDKQEDFQVILSKKNPGESPKHKHYLWMSHWSKASSSAEPQTGKNCNCLEDVKERAIRKDSGNLAYEFMKSTVAERIMIGVSEGSSSMQYARQLNSSTWGATHDACKQLGPKNNGRGDESFERYMKNKSMNLHARAVVSETYSVRKLSELPLNFQKLGSSDDLSSDWDHFPMFEINRKIDNILNPKRRPALGPASLDVNMSKSHVMALPSEEYRMHSHRIADKNTDTCKLSGGIVSRLEDPVGLSSDPAGKKSKRQPSDTMSCSCSKDDNNSSDCPIDEQHTSHCFANSRHELPYASKKTKFKYAGHNEKQILVSAFHNQKTRGSAVDKQQDAAGVMFCAPVLGSEFQNEPINNSNSKKHGEDFHNTDKSRGKAVSSSLLHYEQQHLKTQRMESGVNLKDACDQVANTLTVGSDGESLAHDHESKEMCPGSYKRRGPCLFEKLTVPSKSQSEYPKNSASSEKYNSFGVCMYGTNIGSHLFGTQNQSSTKTETLHSDTLNVSKTSAGIASSPDRKGYGCPNESKTEQLATLPIRGYPGSSKEEVSHNVNEHHDVTSKATIASKQSHVARTGSTNLDLILFKMSRMRNHISSGIAQPPIGAEPSDRWLKRLHFDASDPDIPGSKRPKIRDSPPLEQTNCLIDAALPFSRTDTEMIDHVKEDLALDEGHKLQDNQETPPVLAKSMNSWIGRWCQGGTPVFHEDPGQGRQATKPYDRSEELEGQFPSIAAMAMMGRVMNKLRPCEHQRKGPLVVWKAD